jgi:hypothetical protein
VKSLAAAACLSRISSPGDVFTASRWLLQHVYPGSRRPGDVFTAMFVSFNFHR